MRRLPRITLPARQRGAALLILLALFATAAIYMLVSSLNKSSVTLSLARAEKNRAVLQEAKTALIAWSAAQALTANIPGSLPCPDRDNDGIAESSCSATSTTARLGRLPYKTLGIGELRDASGELLWYGLSENFRNHTGKVSSDTQGTLTVSGLTPATNAVAVVLAPGTALGTQDRPGGAYNAINYLEGINGDNVSVNNYELKAEKLILEPTDPPGTILFNDQLLVITQQDLMSAVEPVIAARIERDIVRQFIYDPSDTSTTTQWSETPGPSKFRYFDAWGAFPFAAPFATYAGSSSPTGQAGTYEGLLPRVSNLNYTWSSGSVVQTGGSADFWGGNDCTPANSNTELRCDIWYRNGTATIRITGTANNIGRSFVQLPRISNLTINGGNLTGKALSGSLNSAGVGTVTLVGTLDNVSSWTNVTITIDPLDVSALTSTTSGETAGWFNRNEWYKQTYYAVSPGYAPGGAGSCNPSSSPYCLTVDNTTTPTNNKRAIVILAGRSLSGTSRPNSTLSDYLEAKNKDTGDYAFERPLGKTTTYNDGTTVKTVEINDRVIVVAP